MTATADAQSEPVSQPTKSDPPDRFVTILIEIILQISHRVAVLTFLGLAGAAYLIFKVNPAFEKVLSFTAIGAEVSIFFAAIGLFSSRYRPATRREARGILIFVGIVFGVILNMMVMTRLTWFRIALHPITEAPLQTELPR